MTDPAPWRHESSLRTWTRRSLTLPAYLAIALLLLAALPVLLFVVLAADTLRRRGLALTRALALAVVYLGAEVAGMAVSLVLWFRYGGWRRTPSTAYLAANFTLQCRWASAILGGARRVLGLRFEVEDEAAPAPGPVVVLARHASPLDNLVPAVFISARHGIRLRWVINRWLLRDPCLDIVGNRLPNAFVDASGTEPAGGAVRVGQLAAGIGTGEGVLIYPEGALFSPDRLRRAVTRLEQAGSAEAGRAAGLSRVLPPRAGGFLAALAAAPDADIVVCSHSGLDPGANYRRLLGGGLTGARVQIRFQRVARSAIPLDADGQVEWLWRAWEAMDAWLGESAAAAAPSGSG